MDKNVISAKLGEPFPQQALKSRRAGGGKDLTYVEGHTVIHRLNDATENTWNFSVDKIERTEIDPANAVLMAYVTLEIPGLGKRSHIGVQSVNARGGEDLVKGCVTDALKKAATLFGVGLELYGPDYEAGELPSGPNLPPRGRTTTQNTVPAGDGDGPTGWTQFWSAARAAGLPNKAAAEEAIGHLGNDPGYAMERLAAWQFDMQNEMAARS